MMLCNINNFRIFLCEQKIIFIDHAEFSKYAKVSQVSFQIHENGTPNLPIFTKKCALHFLVSRAIRLNFRLNETKNGKKHRIAWFQTVKVRVSNREGTSL